jgi:flagellar basal body rod protein FlgC
LAEHQYALSGGSIEINFISANVANKNTLLKKYPTSLSLQIATQHHKEHLPSL